MRSPPSVAIRSTSATMGAALDLLASSSRRLTADGWRRPLLAAAFLIAAVVALSALAGPSPVTVSLFFFASGSSSLNRTIAVVPSDDDLKESVNNVVTSSSDSLKAPPLDSDEPMISNDKNEVTPTSDESAAPHLSPEKLVVALENSSANEVPVNPISEASPPPLSTSENISRNQNNPNGGDSQKLPLQPEETISLTETDMQLIYAKREIVQAPIFSDDHDLYAPLFRNISVFKRSYELMERILKVYIYRDGRRPIFHTFSPVLKGIYASEGWFMKLLEGNTKFVVKDPDKAHLFYLPYSTRQLEHTLYKPDLHDLKPLAIFVKNYVDGISARYPFWNRTRGSDHFLVACHDWGPYTTSLHAELSKYTIKALCNADLTEGFVRGKDVSLPETLVKNPKKPLRDLGGKPVSKRSILAFFAGNMHGRVRPILLDYWKGKDDDMKIYGPLPPQVSKKMSYSQHMKSSKFCICPMGYEVNSPRIVEAIYYECVPVIIADNFVLPFDEVLDWSAFSIVVAERDIPKLKDILLKISSRQYAYMQGNVKRLQMHFLWHPRPVKYDIFHMILHSIWFNRLNQIPDLPINR